jgi:hypothetical protein
LFCCAVEDFAYDLMTWRGRFFAPWEFAFDDMKICPADTASPDLQENVARRQFRPRYLFNPQRIRNYAGG